MIIPKNCLYCGEEFMAKTLKTKYCSHKCNAKHYKIRNKKGELEKHKTLEEELKHSVFMKQIQLSNKSFLSIKETCDLIGISRSTIYRLIKSNELIAYNIGRKVIIPKDEINALMNSFQPVAIPDKVFTIKQNFNMENYFYIGEIQNNYGISEKGLYTILINNSIEKIQIGQYVYVLKTEIIKLLGKPKQSLN